MDIKNVLEQRARAWESAKTLNDSVEAENRNMTAEESVVWERHMADIAGLDARAQRLTDTEKRAAESEAAFRAIEARPATQAAGSADTSLRSFLAGDAGKSYDVRAGKVFGTAEYRALSKLTAAAGANTVPTNFYGQLVAHMIQVSGLLQTGPTVLNTGHGENFQVPKTTAHSTGVVVTEGAAIGASDPTFGQVTLGAIKYGVLTQVSNELLSDTGVDLEGYLAMQVGRALGNAFGTAAVTGSTGVATQSTVGVTSAASLTFDNLIDLYHSVIAPYRSSTSAAWLLNDTTLGAVRKLKDSQNRYLWEPSLQVGAPDVILGKPVYIDYNVANVGVGAKSVLFGDFSTYFVRTVDGIRFERSNDYAFNSDMVTYRGVLRADSALVDLTGSVKAIG